MVIDIQNCPARMWVGPDALVLYGVRHVYPPGTEEIHINHSRVKFMDKEGHLLIERK